MNRDRLEEYMALPVRAEGPRQADAWLIAGDYGYPPSPSEMYVAYRYNAAWYVLGRFEMLHLDAFPTAEVLHALDTKVLPQPADLIVIDAHGQGAGVISILHNNLAWAAQNYGERAVDAGFAGTTKLSDQLVHRRCGTQVTPRGRKPDVGLSQMWNTSLQRR